MNYSSPVPSVDGKRLFAIGSQPRGELERFNQRTQQFEPYMSGISAEGLDFSRDGQWVTYTSYPEGSLWRSKANGSQRLQLTFPPMQARLPRWSPDEKQIAFTAKLPSKRGKTYLVSAEGGAPQPLLPGEQEEGDPNWSPDGTSLVFWSSPYSNGGVCPSPQLSISSTCEPTKCRSCRAQKDCSQLTGRPTVATSWRYRPYAYRLDALRFQDSKVGGTGKNRSLFPELVAGWELHLFSQLGK